MPILWYRRVYTDGDCLLGCDRVSSVTKLVAPRKNVLPKSWVIARSSEMPVDLYQDTRHRITEDFFIGSEVRSLNLTGWSSSTESPLTVPDYKSSLLNASVSLIFFPLRLRAKILYKLLFSCMRVTCRAPLIVVDVVTLIMFCALSVKLHLPVCLFWVHK